MLVRCLDGRIRAHLCSTALNCLPRTVYSSDWISIGGGGLWPMCCMLHLNLWAWKKVAYKSRSRSNLMAQKCKGCKKLLVAKYLKDVIRLPVSRHLRRAEQIITCCRLHPLSLTLSLSLSLSLSLAARTTCHSQASSREVSSTLYLNVFTCKKVWVFPPFCLLWWYASRLYTPHRLYYSRVYNTAAAAQPARSLNFQSLAPGHSQQ